MFSPSVCSINPRSSTSGQERRSLQSGLLALDLFYMGNAEDDQDVASILDEDFTAPFQKARTSPGYQTQGLRDPSKPLRLKSDSGQPLTLGDQLPLCGRRTFFLILLYAACRLFNAQLSVGAQGALRGDAFMGLLGATGAGMTGSSYPSSSALPPWLFDECLSIMTRQERWKREQAS